MSAADDIRFRPATVRDGAPIWQLIEEIGSLERNTLYAYLLLCSHFADTSVVAEWGDRRVGFVVGYKPPTRPRTIFVWQVGVHPDARGKGLGTRLLDAFVDAHDDVDYLEATVGTSNQASQALFRGFANKRGVACEESAGYPGELFGPTGHEDEDLYRIGPLATTP